MIVNTHTRFWIDFAETHLQDNVSVRDQQQTYFKKGWDVIFENNLAAVQAAESLGGKGFSTLQMKEYLTGLAIACSDNGFLFSYSAHLLAFVMPLLKHGTNQQQEYYLKEIVSQKKIACFALTEAQAGSDLSALQCTLTVKNDVFHLRGTKTFITNSHEAEFALVIARSGENTYTAVILHKEQFTALTRFNTMGLRTCSVGEIIIDTTIGKHQILGELNGGLDVLFTAMNYERTLMAAHQLGGSFRLLQQGEERIKWRGHHEHEFILEKLKHTWQQLDVLLDDTCVLLAQSRRLFPQSSEVKLKVSTFYREVCEFAMKVFEEKGIDPSFDYERMFRDSVAASIYSGTQHVQQRIIGTG